MFIEAGNVATVLRWLSSRMASQASKYDISSWTEMTGKSSDDSQSVFNENMILRVGESDGGWCEWNASQRRHQEFALLAKYWKDCQQSGATCESDMHILNVFL